MANAQRDAEIGSLLSCSDDNQRKALKFADDASAHDNGAALAIVHAINGVSDAVQALVLRLQGDE